MQNFFIKYNYKYLDTDGIYGSQCVDLIKQYFKEVLNRPIFKGNAIDYWNNPPQGFTKIAKTLWNYPKPADIIIWKANYNPQGFGHIAIVNWVRTFDFGAFSQNDPVNTPCRFRDYSYKNVIGWLRPTGVQTVPSLKTFIMDYTCFNADPSLMEEARQIFLKYSQGKVDVSFKYLDAPITTQGLFYSDLQVQFLQTYPVSTRFVFLKYVSLGTPNYSYMSTGNVPTTNKYMTVAEGQPSAFDIAYEWTHAIQEYLQDRGVQITIDDIFTPDHDFMQSKWIKILPHISQVV